MNNEKCFTDRRSRSQMLCVECLFGLRLWRLVSIYFIEITQSKPIFTTVYNVLQKLNKSIIEY